MSEIIAAIIGALLAGPAGFLIERFLSRPRYVLSYARVEFEDVVVFSSESQEFLMRSPGFIEWMDNLVPWNFKRSALANYFSLYEVRTVRDLGRQFANGQEAVVKRVRAKMQLLDSDEINEIEKILSEFMLDYFQAFNRQVFEDYRKDPTGTVDQFKKHMREHYNNVENIAIPFIHGLIAECQQNLDRGRGTSDRLIVRVGFGNRGIQDGLIEAEASLETVGKVFRLPVKLVNRPWSSEDQDGNGQDSNYLRLPPRSFRVLEFLVDEDLNAKADLDILRRALRRGAKAHLVIFGLGRRQVASIGFEARLPD
jgi:hypothetical protein